MLIRFPSCEYRGCIHDFEVELLSISVQTCQMAVAVSVPCTGSVYVCVLTLLYSFLFTLDISDMPILALISFGF